MTDWLLLFALFVWTKTANALDSNPLRRGERRRRWNNAEFHWAVTGRFPR